MENNQLIAAVIILIGFIYLLLTTKNIKTHKVGSREELKELALWESNRYAARTWKAKSKNAKLAAMNDYDDCMEYWHKIQHVTRNHNYTEHGPIDVYLFEDHEHLKKT